MFVRERIEYLHIILYLIDQIEITLMVLLRVLVLRHHIFDVKVRLHQLLRHLLVRLIIVLPVADVQQVVFAHLVDLFWVVGIEDELDFILKEWE